MNLFSAGDYLKLFVKYLKALAKLKQLQANNIGIQEENERLCAIIEDLKNGSVY